MLVFKRFVRNRLAVVGTVMLAAMFVFSFVGGIVSPYKQEQTFYKTGAVWKEYASLSVNAEFRYSVDPGRDLPTAARAQFILAMNAGKPDFSAGGLDYRWEEIGEDLRALYGSTEIAVGLPLAGAYTFTAAPGADFPDGLAAAASDALGAGLDAFEWDGGRYALARSGKRATVSALVEIALASARVFDAFTPKDEPAVAEYAFRRAALFAIAGGADTFSYDGRTFTVGAEGETSVVHEISPDGERTEFAMLSPYIAQGVTPDIRVTVAFKDAILDAVRAREGSFSYPDPDGADREYQLSSPKPDTYTVKRETLTQLYDVEARPSAAHWLGTDSNGMDMLTRLMHGGRISLMVGFIVVLIELFIGVVVGGVAGYFGGIVDLCLMRFIDLFNSVPQWPLLIIMGSVMDTLEIDPYARIYLLMVVLGILGWTGIARVVRGQILTLREQDFMVAAEAAGIRVSARIFRHLVPNVMPLLIVQATLSLGGIILTEATLSFLGMGLKYPLASWGTIINAATSIYTMTNFWYLWIPAGMLILITVLGFNFVGDGLRDAFDPKMKR
jgi:peptide/nickel transport system permease protein